MRIVIAIVTVAIAASMCAAQSQQDSRYPLSFFWTGDGPYSPHKFGEDSGERPFKFVGIQGTDLGSGRNVDGAATALGLADSIGTTFAAGHLDATTCLALIRGFGASGRVEDIAPDNTGANSAFWIPADALGLPTTIFLSNNDDPNDLPTANYRHPFLHNAMVTNEQGQPYEPPMRRWTQAMVNKLQSEFEHRTAPGLPISDPRFYRFYQDGEGNVYGATSNDFAVFREFVLHRRVRGGIGVPSDGSPVFGWWDDKPVPGFGGLTLASLYSQERLDRELAGLSAWPADIVALAQGGFDPTRGTSEYLTGQNSSYLEW